MTPFQKRVALIALAAVIAGVTTVLTAWKQDTVSDFFQVYRGAEFLRNEVNPYERVGPGAEVDQFYGLYYPIPALIVATPFTGLTFPVANTLWAMLGAGLMMWAFTKRKDDPRMLFTLSGAFIFSVAFAQWEPLLVTAALTPALGFLLVAKPTVGFALFAAYPSSKAFIGGALFLIVSFVLWPSWPVQWLSVASEAPSARPLALHPIGVLALLAFARWRDGDARLVGVSALVPLTPLPYSAVLLFPAAKHMREVVALIVGSWLSIALHRYAWPYESDVARLDFMRGVMAATCWLPMAALILLRPYFARRAAHATGSASGGVPSPADRAGVSGASPE